jgi:hypothetical protein
MRTHIEVKEIHVFYTNFHYMMHKVMFGSADRVYYCLYVLCSTVSCGKFVRYIPQAVQCQGRCFFSLTAADRPGKIAADTVIAHNRNASAQPSNGLPV